MSIDTQTLTLTDFLLARIAEDEVRWASAEAPWTAPHDPRCDYPGDISGTCDCNLLARLKVECEAKRLIVGAMVAPENLVTEDARRVAELAREVVLGNLALPYADHPDYREEWRP